MAKEIEIEIEIQIEIKIDPPTLYSYAKASEYEESFGGRRNQKPMDLLQKPTLRQNICGITLLPKAVFKTAPDGSVQPFFNTYIDTGESELKPAYFGKANASFSQSGKETAAGTQWDQSLTIRFPNTDLRNANRIAEYMKAEGIAIRLSGGQSVFLGRNDYYQNAKPRISVNANNNIVEVTYRCASIFPAGLTNGAADHLLGEDIPINFFNL